MSVMVAELDSIPSEKRISLLHKEQITDKNSMIQMNLDTYESTITMKQNHDIPIVGDDETDGRSDEDHLPEKITTVYSGANQ